MLPELGVVGMIRFFEQLEIGHGSKELHQKP